MTSLERRAVFSLAGVYFLRMFGLFSLLPVVVIYSEKLPGYTPFLAGIALGAYGLSQALLQIPFGVLSDKYGRKRIIVIGLGIFIIGSVVAALSSSMFGLILGRALQGAGAISAVVLALNADLTRTQQRAKSMAIIGVSIGVAFMLSLISAPALQGLIGVKGLFWLIACLAVLAIGLTIKVVPVVHDTSSQSAASTKIPYAFKDVLHNKALWHLSLGIFISHMVLTALFVALPVLLQNSLNIPLKSHWQFYLPVLFISVLGMTPFIRANGKDHRVNLSYKVAVALLLMALILLAWVAQSPVIWTIGFAVVVFFVAFNALESMLPALVSRVVSSHKKGAAIGVYNSFQFLGVFVGGAVAGSLWQWFSMSGVFVFCIVAVLLWVVLVFFSAPFSLLSTKSFSISALNMSQSEALIARIKQLDGVDGVIVIEDGDNQQTINLHVNDKLFNQTQLDQLIHT